MKRTLFIILLLSFQSYSQSLIGTWKVVSYEDKNVYFNKPKDSVSFKIPEKEHLTEYIKQISERIIFLDTYSFFSDGKYNINHIGVGQKIDGKYTIDELNKKILMIDDKGKKDEFPYNFINDILFLEMKMRAGEIKLGLTKVSN